MKIISITISDADPPSISVNHAGGTIGSLPFPESMNARKIATVLRELARALTKANDEAIYEAKR